MGCLLAAQNGIPPTALSVRLRPRLDYPSRWRAYPIQEKDQRSFEALAAVVYRPETIQTVDNYHREILEKTCVISAQDDHLHSIKTFLLHGASSRGCAVQHT